MQYFVKCNMTDIVELVQRFQDEFEPKLAERGLSLAVSVIQAEVYLTGAQDCEHINGYLLMADVTGPDSVKSDGILPVYFEGIRVMPAYLD